MSLDSGTRLGPFEIRDRIELPGFGEVYAARDHDHARDVVIHVLRTNAARDEEVRDRFEHDVRAAAARVQPEPLRIHLTGVDPQAIYVVSDPIRPAGAPFTPVTAPRVSDAVRHDVRAPRRAWIAVAAVAIALTAIAVLTVGRGDDPLEQGVPQATTTPAPTPAPTLPPPPPERELLPPEMTEVRDYVVTPTAPRARRPAAASARPRPSPGDAREAPPPRAAARSASAAPGQAAAPRQAPAPSDAPAPSQAAAPSRSAAAARVPSPSASTARAPRAGAPKPAVADSRDTTTLLTEATVHATEFDLERALDLLEVAAARGDAFARIAALYVRGLIAAREAFRGGGDPETLAPVRASIMTLAEISRGQPGAAEIARLALHAAAAAAQSERDEMRLYIEAAIRMETLQLAAGQGGAPVVSASELAGDLWLQVHRYEDARDAYTQAAERVGFTLRILSGLARTARRLNDMPAACTAYRRLVDVWGARPGLPVEIAEARAYLGGCPR